MCLAIINWGILFVPEHGFQLFLIRHPDNLLKGASVVAALSAIRKESGCDVSLDGEFWIE